MADIQDAHARSTAFMCLLPDELWTRIHPCERKPHFTVFFEFSGLVRDRPVFLSILVILSGECVGGLCGFMPSGAPGRRGDGTGLSCDGACRVVPFGKSSTSVDRQSDVFS